MRIKISGIYKIQSIIKPDRFYIGSATNIKTRWRGHLYELRRNKHGSSKLQNHFNKYGESDLQFSILLGCEKSELIVNEQFFIDSLNPTFNACKIAGNCLGFKASIETRLKLSRMRKGKPKSDEHRKNMSIAHTGKKMSPQAIENNRKAKLGRKHSLEFCRNLSIAKLKCDYLKIPISQFTIDGEWIRDWPCMHDITRTLNINYGNICSVCKNKQKSAGGFVFKYKKIA